ncbi:hypothetical protein COMA2_100142 [Candidatus Nitrospira nitrificans]|uniref:Uncharacterized protein n=1 Tax=Candidatus Nitrospira nitrificans TaxID=1742973 RepID=A0A0S4L7A4_9BACT|nr:hypothetical protein COMA2_100142 [Candidatus Nitrospira nitrificans]
MGEVPVLAHRAHGMLFELKLGAALDACAQWEPSLTQPKSEG